MNRKLLFKFLLILFSTAISVAGVRAEKAAESPAAETRTEDVQLQFLENS